MDRRPACNPRFDYVKGELAGALVMLPVLLTAPVLLDATLNWSKDSMAKVEAPNWLNCQLSAVLF